MSSIRSVESVPEKQFACPECHTGCETDAEVRILFSSLRFPCSQAFLHDGQSSGVCVCVCWFTHYFAARACHCLRHCSFIPVCVCVRLCVRACVCDDRCCLGHAESLLPTHCFVFSYPTGHGALCRGAPWPQADCSRPARCQAVGLRSRVGLDQQGREEVAVNVGDDCDHGAGESGEEGGSGRDRGGARGEHRLAPAKGPCPALSTDCFEASCFFLMLLLFLFLFLFFIYLFLFSGSWSTVARLSEYTVASGTVWFAGVRMCLVRDCTFSTVWFSVDHPRICANLARC